MTYQLVVKHSTRRKRSIKVEVHPDNTVEVVAPIRTPQRAIDTLLETKNDWIQKRLQFNQDHADKLKPKTFKDGEAFYYMGSSYPLKLTTEKKPGVWFQDGNLMVHPKKNTAKTLEAWYKQCAYDILLDRVDVFAKQLQLQPQNMRIKRMKTRWGSCSSAGNINLNWALVMAPLPVMDYVVIHELCHLKHMNHSKTFWNLVESVCPDYKEYTKWLKDHGAFLNFSVAYE